MSIHSNLKSRSRNRSILAAITLFASLYAPLSAQKLVSFDAPGGGTGPYQGTESAAINIEGAITGTVVDSSYGIHGFVRSPDGKFVNFDAPDANPVVGCTCPNAINDLGVVAGEYFDSNSVSHGFLRFPDGKIISFDAPGAGTAANQGTFPYGVNDFGLTAGYFNDANNASHSFLRSPDGKITVIDPPDAGTAAYQGSYAVSVNNFGTLAGTFTDANNLNHGFVRAPDGKITTFDPPGAVGGTVGTLNALVTDLGLIAGDYIDANSSVSFGFERTPSGKYIAYQASEAGSAPFDGTWLDAVNIEGATTGYVTDANLENHSFIRDPCGHITVFDVPGQIAVPNSYLGSAGEGINASGVVAGRWHDAAYAAHGYILYPRK